MPASPDLLEPLTATLAHRGTDGCDLLILGSAALGHQHFWTTPEEVGERQPLLEGRSMYIVMAPVEKRPEKKSEQAAGGEHAGNDARPAGETIGDALAAKGQRPAAPDEASAAQG